MRVGAFIKVENNMFASKALIVPIVGVIVWLLSQIGITEGMTIVDAVTTLVTMGLVYMIPNKA